MLLLIVLLAVTALGAQEVEQADDWTAFTSMNQLNSLLLHQGGVWLGTSGGVLHFDQTDRVYTRYTRLDGLSSNKVLALAADSAGDLWFGTDRKGLNRLRTATAAFDPPFLDFEGLQIFALLPFEDGLFVGMERGISVFLTDKEEVKETYRKLGALAKDTPVTSLALFDGKLWAGTPEGIAWAALDQPNLQDPESWSIVRTVGQVQDMVVANDQLFIIGNNRVRVFEPATGRFAEEFSQAEPDRLGLQNGVLVASTGDGRLFGRLGPQDWDAIGFPRLDQVQALSRQGDALWIATSEGLKVLGAPELPPVRDPPANQFHQMALTNDGSLWVASMANDQVRPYRGMYQFDGTDWTIFNTENGLPSDKPITFATDDEGRLVVGTWGEGVAVLQADSTWVEYNHTNSALQGVCGADDFIVVSDIERDPSGLVWLANIQGGLIVVDGFPHASSAVYDNAALDLAECRDIGRISIAPDGLKWLSTPRDGFILFDDGGTPFDEGDDFAFRINTNIEGRLSSDRTTDVLSSQPGELWVASNNGLNAVSYTYDPLSSDFRVVSWRLYSTTNGMPSNEINVLAADGSGNIWVGSEAGLTRIGQNGEIDFTLTAANSGLIDNRIKSLLFDDDSGALWIATFDGLSRLKTASGQTQAPTDLRVYPNPFQTGSRSAELTFSGLPLGASLRIFTTGGSLIAQVPGQPGRGSLTWNGQNEAGFIVASGIYYYLAQDDNGNGAKGTFAVINAP
ncbi:MAG: hypothetical protein GKR89_08730 [Candidatus Latescibacteria bacterium]|nr:hypothetical protein [Candidatus Latescibacterota bacterium]